MLTPEEQPRVRWNPQFPAEIETAEEEAEWMERDDGTEPDRWWLWRLALVILALAGVAVVTRATL